MFKETKYVRFSLLFLPSILCLLSSGCNPVGIAAGVGASVGVAVAQEGGFRTSITDNTIQLKINDLWLKYNFEMFRKLRTTVKEGRVLIIGSVPNPDMRVEAIRLAWQADGVKQILNEITVDDGSGITTMLMDGWTTSNLKTKLLLDKHIQSINYNIDTVNGSVYLMGIAQDQKELDHVIGYARNASRVNNVVSYVRLRGEKPAGVMEPSKD
ncbi:MAG: BON domain-containing protein [Alphaproteobacteria bacterium]|nr:BON domain-containing protein [Alphaproteobacteria bacterium]MCK5555397.1 BON domain-containing protein [Alphaproteobacteria bacterium]MCK5659691.1 BON domain-containing protein [Alphaproteobacteria bacterium]